MSSIRKIELWKIKISPDGTHHVYEGRPLYKERFKAVMSFHEPGVAAVIDETGAYHINLNGEPIYDKRYKMTFGYYEGIATVVDEEGYLHIDLSGEPIHNKKFPWAGNFQESRCVVRDKDGTYYHIDQNGEPVYNERYAYAGDYKYGIAVVYDFDGYAYHIDQYGRKIHDKKFLELYPFHKGFAVARDRFGYFHINRRGEPLYNKRFRYVEDFYNDQALAWMWDGTMAIIDTHGNIIHRITDETSEAVMTSLKYKLMKKLVGYWDTQIIYAIVKSGILDNLRKEKCLSFSQLLDKTKLPQYSLRIMLEYLQIHGYIRKKDCGYEITNLGSMLTDQHGPDSLKYAAIMWAEEHYVVLGHLYEALRTESEVFSKIHGLTYYDYLNRYPEKYSIFEKAMRAYVFEYKELIDKIKINEKIRTIADIGGGHGEILAFILKKNPWIKKGILFDTEKALAVAKKFLETYPISDKIEYVPGNFLDKIPFSTDAAILAKVLHDWDDEKALLILRNVAQAVRTGGYLYIIEIIKPEQPIYDLGVSLSFMLLAMLKGKERTLPEYKRLLSRAGFILEDIIYGYPNSVLVAKKVKEI